MEFVLADFEARMDRLERLMDKWRVQHEEVMAIYADLDRRNEIRATNKEVCRGGGMVDAQDLKS